MTAVDEPRQRMSPAAYAVMAALTDAFPDVGGEVTDAAEARRILASAPERPADPPPVGEVADTAIPGPEGAPDLPVRIYRPERARAEARLPRPTVVFFHGGGFVLCGLDTHDRAARALCRESGAVVVSVAYRLAPEARFPAPAEDAYAALCWAAGQVGALGGDPRALVVAGDSAGGNLAAVAALMARDRGGPAPALQVLIYPVTDTREDTASRRANGEGYYLTRRALRWFQEQYLGPDGDPAHPYAAPLRADLRGLPPAHVVTAGCDPLCDEGRAYADRLREAGVPVEESRFPGMFHGFFGFPELLEESAEAQRYVGQTIAATVKDRKIAGDDRETDG
ncbi:alpha/beta hydrolase [Streptomyces sp. ODS28]|uniref:alpha/beta hydrolase n=1 Tax=Streptomyces sp. ODS28 TaxID=3136688 RepID=UPI0031E6968F